LFVKWFSHTWNGWRSLQYYTWAHRCAKHTTHWTLHSLSTCKIILNFRLRLLSNSVRNFENLFSWFYWWKDFIFFRAKNIKSKWFVAQFNIMGRMWEFSNDSHRFYLFVRRSLKLLMIIVNLLWFEILINDFSCFWFKQIRWSQCAVSQHVKFAHRFWIFHFGNRFFFWLALRSFITWVFKTFRTFMFSLMCRSTKFKTIAHTRSWISFYFSIIVNTPQIN